MAKRKSLNRRRSSTRRSTDSIGSGFLDPDSSIIDEERTSWWNHLQENTLLPHFFSIKANETARQLTANSQLDSSQGSPKWWENLEHSDSEHVALSSRPNLSAALLKANVLLTSTSESEIDIELRKKKIQLKAKNNRKSINNAFLNALNDSRSETADTSKLQEQRANHSDLHDANRKVSQEKFQEENEDNSSLNLSDNIVKLKSSISRKRKKKNIREQNPFQDILTKDGGSMMRKLIRLEKESSKRLVDQNIANEDHAITDSQRKSMRVFHAVPLENIETDSLNLLPSNVEVEVLENNANEIVQDSEESTENVLNRLKPKSRFMQRTRKSIGRNAFADALVDDSSASLSATEPNKENDIHESPSTSRSSLRLSKRSANRSKIDIYEDSMRKSPRSSLNIAKRQSLNVPMQAEDNIEENIETGSLNLIPSNVEGAVLENNANETVQDSEESTEILLNRLKPKSRFMQRARKSIGRNAFADALADNSSSASLSATEPNKENDIHESPLSLRLSKRSANRSKTDIHEDSMRKSPRSSLNVAKKQSLDVPKRVKGNIEEKLSNSSLDDNKSRGKRSVLLKPKLRKSKENIETVSLISLPLNVEDAVLENNVNETVQDSEESTEILLNRLKPKSRFMQRARKSVGRNAFAEALADDSSARLSATEPNKENDIHEFPLSLRLSKRSANRSKTDIHEDSMRKSPRSSLNVAKKQTNISMQTKDNIEENSSSSSLDDNKSRGKRSRFLNSKLKTLTNSRKSVANPYKEIFEQDSDVNIRKNVSTKDNDTPLVRDKTATRISQVRESSAIEKNSQSRAEDLLADTEDTQADTENSYDISLRVSSNTERDVPNTSSKCKTKLSENSDHANASKSISRKNTIAKTSEKETSFSRKSIREETLKKNTHTNAILNAGRASTNEIVTHDVVSDDIDIEDLSLSKRLSKLNDNKGIRLTHNSLRNQSELLNTNMVDEVINNSHNDINREHDLQISTRSSKSSLVKEAHLTRNSLRNRSETPKRATKDMELSKRSMNLIPDTEKVDTDAEINVDDISQVISSTRISKVSAGTHKSIIVPVEIETIDGEDTEHRMQTIQQNSTSSKTETGSKTVNRQSVQSLNKTSIKENKEIAGRQKSLSKSQNHHSTAIKASSKNISSNASKLNSSKTTKKIYDFFKVKQTSTPMATQSNDRAQSSQIFDTEKMEKIKTELEKIKNREMAAMKIAAKKESMLKSKRVNSIPPKQATKKPLANPTKVIDKAFLVNGKVYKPPRLPRPKHWATDRLYKFLWNRMEPKYQFTTRLKSEKFMVQLAEVVSLIERRKNYNNYETELTALMKEMARLELIENRNDFYHFCQEFLPREVRLKVIPMLLPGNKMNIPYDPEELHVPLLDVNNDE